MSQPPDERDQQGQHPGPPDEHEPQPVPRADVADRQGGALPAPRPTSEPVARPAPEPALQPPTQPAQAGETAPEPAVTQPIATAPGPAASGATDETTAVWAVHRVSGDPTGASATPPPTQPIVVTPVEPAPPTGPAESGPTNTVPPDSEATDSEPTGREPTGTAVPPPATPIAAKRPVAAPPVLIPALVLAVALALIGVVGVHDALARAGVWLHGPTWVGMVIEHTNGTTSSLWMSVAGIVLALIGLWLLILALKPRRRHGLQLQATSTVWLDFKAIATIATATATSTEGIAEARSKASRRRVTVDAVMAPDATADPGELSRRIQREVTDRLAPLVRPPTVRVHLREPAGSDSSAAEE